jgi:hypothetical protein
VRKHTSKKVPECLRLRNHIIFITIFSLGDVLALIKRARVPKVEQKFKLGVVLALINH